MPGLRPAGLEARGAPRRRTSGRGRGSAVAVHRRESHGVRGPAVLTRAPSLGARDPRRIAAHEPGPDAPTTTSPRSPPSTASRQRWSRALGGSRAPTASTAPRPRAEVYSIDTPPPTVSGSLHVGHVFSYTHTDLHRPLPAHARASRSSTRWAGTTTACPPSAGCRTTTACAATRRCPTTRRSSRRPKPDAKQPGADLAGRNFVELCERADRRGREGLRGRCGAASGCRSTGR